MERVSDERRRPKFNIDVPLDDEPLPAHPVKSPKGSMDRSGVSKAKEKLLDSYEDRMEWAKKMLVNIANAGYFSSDRTIAQYEKEIWKLSEGR